ncbi:sugar kinase [Tropicimonas sp. IMCC6043]|uniref:tagatose kinase n=1 Tax=Tropicimonas sp. IMCC6043 TaxID=2510645 RepID=UPI00101C3CDE|nr:sugar kinase [Tropicimonas sp. IMCC6043]RYH12269.1 sugar kinase [Tropicimonas sp. IMCC6043]
MKKVVTIGEIVVEIMAMERGIGFREPLTLRGPFPSGAPAIFVDQVARLGHPCGIISCVGNDDFGRLNIERLAADGVDVSAIRIDPEAATGSAFVRYREDGNRDFVFNIKHSANGRVGPSPDVNALLESADCLHVMGSALFCEATISLTLDAVDRIKAKGGTVSFDPNLRKEMLDLPGMREAMRAILEKTDLFLPSGDEVSLLTTADGEEAALAELLERGVRAVVLKRGARGASYVDADRRFDQAAFPVEEVDPTGAGDSFGGAFVTAWLRGEPPEAALRLAAAAGALAVTRKGPMEGTSTRAEIDAFLDRLTEAGAPI